MGARMAGTGLEFPEVSPRADGRVLLPGRRPRSHGSPPMSPTPATQGRSTLLMMDLLSLGDRPVLRDLARWCDLLLSDLRAPASTGDLMVVSTALKQYALIEALRGHGERAEAACPAQIRWAVRTAGAMGDRRLLAHAMQPWVNLGRLHRRA